MCIDIVSSFPAILPHAAKACHYMCPKPLITLSKYFINILPRSIFSNYHSRYTTIFLLD